MLMADRSRFTLRYMTKEGEYVEEEVPAEWESPYSYANYMEREGVIPKQTVKILYKGEEFDTYSNLRGARNFYMTK